MEIKSIGEVSQVNLSQIRGTHKGPISYVDTSSVVYGKFNSPIIYSSVQDAPSRARRLAKSGDTVISTVRPKMCHYGYISSVNEKDIFSTGFVVVHPQRQVIEPYYLYLVLTSDEVTEKLQQIAETSTTTYPSIKPSDITSIDIIIPSRKYQQDVAGIIGAIDEKIVLNQQINKNLLQMMETKWRKQFEGLDANQGHFTDLADVVAGGTPSKKQSEYFGGNIAWITPKDMSKTTRVFIEHGTLNITKIGLNNSSAKLIPKGTILFSSRAPIGYIGIAANPVSTNQGFKSLVPKRKEFTEYLYFLLKRLTPLIENIASGSTFKEISGAGMKSVGFPLPTSDMIEAFHHEARSLFDLIKCNEKQSQYLNFIRNLILPKLLSGDINLSGIEEAIKNA